MMGYYVFRWVWIFSACRPKIGGVTPKVFDEYSRWWKGLIVRKVFLSGQKYVIIRSSIFLGLRGWWE